MKSFLCVNHKQELASQPTKALRAWAKSYEDGQSFVASDSKLDALAPLGCAFEIAELLLSIQAADFYDRIFMLTASTATYAKTLKQLQLFDQSENVVALAVDRLHKELLVSPEYAAFIQNQIVTLRYFVADPQVTDFPSVADHFHWFGEQAHLANQSLH